MHVAIIDSVSLRFGFLALGLALGSLVACSDEQGEPNSQEGGGASGGTFGGGGTSSGDGGDFGADSGGGTGIGGGAGEGTGGDMGVGGSNEPSYPLVEARNPNIWADVPDPSVVRVGSTYYMSSTTMHMNPGVPIMKSTDLVNWEVINYAHRALDETNENLNLTNGKNAYGGGSWASSIRYHEGTFYVLTFSHTTNKTYVYRTKDIEKGSWETHVINGALHDGSLFFDDGRAFVIHGVDNISITELTSDATAIKAGGLNQVIIQKASSIAGSQFYVTAEGAQVQHINGWYYVNLISWPAGKGRTQLLYRSKNLTGPYEGRVVFEDNTAQGGMIDTPNGEWFAYLFRDSGAVGRIPYLIPLHWEEDWPVIGVDGRTPETLGFQVEDRGLIGIIRSDEFSEADLDLVWQWNHNPEASGWSLTERPGYMRIKATRTDLTLVATRNTLTQRMFGPTCTGTVALEVGGLKDGDYAGLGALQEKYGFVGVRQSGGGTRSIVMVNASSGSPQEIASVPLDQERVYLRVTGDFRNRTDIARFYYSLDGEEWTQLGNELHMEYTLSHFMGYRFALFHFGTQNTGGYADFDYFHVDE